MASDAPALRTMTADSLYYDDGNAAPDDFLGFGSATAFYAATRFTPSSDFTLTGTRIAYRTQSGVSDFVIAVFDDAAGPNNPTGGQLLLSGTASDLSPNGRLGEYAFDPIPFAAGESFFLIVGFADVPFPVGTDTGGTGNYTGRSFFSGTSNSGDWAALGDILENGQQDVWVIRALGDAGGGGGETPDIAVTPSSLSATLAPGASTTLNLTVGNTGAGPLTWSAATSTARQAAPESTVGELYGQRAAATDAAALRQTVQSRGWIPVIVGLEMPFRPEAELGRADAVTAQRRTIVTKREALLDRLAAYDVQRVKRFETVPYVAMTVDAAGLDALLADPEVYEVHEDAWLEPSLAQSTQIIGAPEAWSQGFTGTGQTVAVLDTGVDTGHPFFGGRTVAEACFSSSQPGVAQSLCPSGQQQQTGPGAAGGCTGIEGCEHGTHVAGIAVGEGSAFSGVARGANLIAVQVFTEIVDAGVCGGSAPCVRTAVSDQILGLEYVFAQRNAFSVASVNMSLGGGQFSGASCDGEPQKPIIDNLRAAGIATIIASGNESFTNAIGSPACISSAIAVGSTQDGSGNTVVDNVSPFSNSSEALDLLAPGQWIESSVPGGGFGTLAGTSMAAPHVAGAWAVLKQQNPQASVSDIFDAIASTGVPITDPRNGITRSRLQLDAALGTGGGDTWFSVSPASGTTPAGGSSSLTVTLDAGGLGAGTYNGTITLASNDPDEAVVTVPVTLTVGGGATGGVLSHLSDADTQHTFTTPAGGYVHGTNEFGDLAKAVAFEVPTDVPNALTGVDLYLSARNATPVVASYTLRIYGGSPAAGPEGAPLFERTYALAEALVDADPDTPSPATELRFAPVTVPDAFFVAVEYEAPYGNDDFNIASTNLLGAASPYEWERWGDGSWNNMSQAWFQSGNDGWHLWVEAVMGSPVANEAASGPPDQPTLAPNFPNPFAASTTLRYALPRAADVRLEVFDALGRRVATLADGEQAAGAHEVTWDAGTLASGVYIARLVSAGSVETQRLTLLR